jgi:hypothetical protein
VVTKDVAPYAIVAGNPARVIRQRFSANVARRLQQLAWWDWSHDRLRAALPGFRQLTIDGFLEKYERASAPKPKRRPSQISRPKSPASGQRLQQTTRS